MGGYSDFSGALDVWYDRWLRFACDGRSFEAVDDGEVWKVVKRLRRQVRQMSGRKGCILSEYQLSKDITRIRNPFCGRCVASFNMNFSIHSRCRRDQ